MRIANGIDVYDDDTDEWLRFDTEGEAEAYANPPAEPEPKLTEIQAATTMRTFTVPLPLDGSPVKVLSQELDRTRVLLACDGGSVIIGTSNLIHTGATSGTSGLYNGLIVFNFPFVLKTTDELWVCAVNTATVPFILSVLTESRSV